MEEILFYLLLIDALFANGAAWFAREWYAKNMGLFAKWLPMGKGWAILYLSLVLWAGSLLYRMGVLL